MLDVSFSYEVLHFRFNVLYDESSVLFNKVIGVPVDSGIIMIFAPAYIHPDFFALSINFSLNRLMDFDYPSKSYGIFRMALLNSFMPVVNV